MGNKNDSYKELSEDFEQLETDFDNAKRVFIRLSNGIKNIRKKLLKIRMEDSLKQDTKFKDIAVRMAVERACNFCESDAGVQESGLCSECEKPDSFYREVTKQVGQIDT
jgi:hypothetical protein